MKTALALYYLVQVHRKEPKIYTKLKAVTPDVLEDQQQEQLIAQKRKRLRKSRQSSPRRSRERKGERHKYGIAESGEARDEPHHQAPRSVDSVLQGRR